MPQLNQHILDTLLKQLTTDSIVELKEELGLQDRAKWRRAFIYSKRKRPQTLLLVKACRNKISEQKMQAQRVVVEVDKILNSEMVEA